MQHKELIKLEQSMQTFTNYFVKRYFGNDADTYWIADSIGDVLFVNDFFFDLSDMVDFIKYKYTTNQMIDYYYYRLELQSKDISETIKVGKVEGKETIICIRDWKKLKIKK